MNIQLGVFLLGCFVISSDSYQQCTTVSVLNPYHVCEVNVTVPGSDIATTIPSGCPPYSKTLTAGSASVTECKCLAGYYGIVDSSGSVDSCTPCVPGTYSLAVGYPLSDTCVTCPAGFYCSSISQLPIPCIPGTFSGGIMAYNSSVCTPFPTGFYGNITAATSMAQASACPVGSFSFVEGMNPFMTSKDRKR